MLKYRQKEASDMPAKTSGLEAVKEAIKRIGSVKDEVSSLEPESEYAEAVKEGALMGVSMCLSHLEILESEYEEIEQKD